MWFGFAFAGVFVAGKRHVDGFAVISGGSTSVVGLPLVVVFFGVGQQCLLQQCQGALAGEVGSSGGCDIPLLWIVAVAFSDDVVMLGSPA